MAFNKKRCMRFICTSVYSATGYASISIGKSVEGRSYYFSKDEGKTWAENSISNLSVGDVVYVKGTGYSGVHDESKYTNFTTRGQFNLAGSVMSLIDDGAGEQTTIDGGETGNGTFFRLFYRAGIDAIIDPNFFSATVSTVRNAYRQMFNASSITDLPDDLLVPLNTVPHGTFYYMFFGCTRLKKAPRGLFSAAQNWPGQVTYSGMFYRCTSLKQIDFPFHSFDLDVGGKAFYEWVAEVPSGGTFICPDDLPRTYGTSAIPNGWTTNLLVDPINAGMHGVYRGTKEFTLKDKAFYQGSAVPLVGMPTDASRTPKMPVGPATLLTGSQIRTLRENLVNPDEIQKIDFIETSTFPESSVCVSTADSIRPVNMWYDSTEHALHFGSMADKIYANADMGAFFYNLRYCAEADITWVDMSTAKSLFQFIRLFGSKLDSCRIIGIENMDIRNVTNCNTWLFDSSIVLPEYSRFHFDSVVENVGCFIGQLKNLTDEAFAQVKFYFPNATHMSGGADSARFLQGMVCTKIPASAFVFGKPLTGDIKCLVSGDSVKEIDMSSWPVKLDPPEYNASTGRYERSVEHCFFNLHGLTDINLLGWDIHNANMLSGFLWDCENLVHAYVSDAWIPINDTSSLITGKDDAVRCVKLHGRFNISTGNTNNQGGPEWLRGDTPNGQKPPNRGLLYYWYGEAELLDGRELNIELKRIALRKTSSEGIEVYTACPNIKRIASALQRSNGGSYLGTISKPSSPVAVHVFTNVGDTELEIVTNAMHVYTSWSGTDRTYNSTSDMFRHFENATSIELSWFDTSRSQLVGGHMFYDCWEMTDCPGLENLDFTGSGRVKLGLPDTYAAANLQSIFRYCHKMTDKAFERLNSCKFDIISDAYVAFEECNALSDISLKWNMSSIAPGTILERMFYNCKGLKSFTCAEAKNWVHAGQTREMFRGCTALQYADLSGITYPYNCWAMLWDCSSMVEINLRNWRSDKITHPSQLSAFCGGSPNLEKLYLDREWTLPVPEMDWESLAYDTFASDSKLRGQCDTSISRGYSGRMFQIDDPYHGQYGLGSIMPQGQYIANSDGLNLDLKALVGTAAQLDAEDNKIKHIKFAPVYRWPFGTYKYYNTYSNEYYTKADGTQAQIRLNNGFWFQWDSSTGTITMYSKCPVNYGGGPREYEYLKALEDVDLSWIRFSEINSLAYQFYYDTSLKTVKWPTEKCNAWKDDISLVGMYQGCSALEFVDMSFLNFFKADSFKLTSMFNSCLNLKDYRLPSGITNEVSANFIFYDCQKITLIDLSSIQAKKFEISSAFKGCVSLTGVRLPAIQTDGKRLELNWENLFMGDTQLGHVDFSGFKLRDQYAVISAYRMFSGCSNLRKIYLPPDPADWAPVFTYYTSGNPFCTGAALLTGELGGRLTSDKDDTRYAFYVESAEHPKGMCSILHDYI